MTTLSWDDIGERYFETGVDRAVLYPPVGPGIPWNGLISVTETPSGVDNAGIYFDGVKYAVNFSVSEFSGTLKAITYPDEFLEFEGITNIGSGLFVANQETKRFGLSYRTKIGNDEDGSDHGYKIHVLYNVIATPSNRTFQTIGSKIDPIQFEWAITAIPSEIPGYRPSAHLIFDTRYMNASLLHDVEDSLYGDGFSSPILPTAAMFAGFINNWVVIRISDNYDGTWTAEGPDDLVFMIDATTFQINRANTTVIDSNTFMITNLTN